MPETLLSPSRILLYGRVVVDLQIVVPPPPPGPVPNSGVNVFLENQIRAPGAALARIYGFSYEGHYYDLATPALFIVNGPGVDADAKPAGPRVSRAPDVADKTGLGATCRSFSDDMRVWGYDKSEFTIRLDVGAGPLDEILLEAELSSEKVRTYYGAKGRVRRMPPGSFEEE